MTISIAEKFFNEIAQEQRVQEAKQDFANFIDKSDEIASKVLKTLLNDDTKATLDEMILGLSRAMTNLSYLFFESKEEYEKAKHLVRHDISERVSDSIVAPKPCSECESCLSGVECENPINVNVPFGSIPMLVGTLIEEAYWEACLSNKLN